MRTNAPAASLPIPMRNSGKAAASSASTKAALLSASVPTSANVPTTCGAAAAASKASYSNSRSAVRTLVRKRTRALVGTAAISLTSTKARGPSSIVDQFEHGAILQPPVRARTGDAGAAHEPSRRLARDDQMRIGVHMSLGGDAVAADDARTELREHDERRVSVREGAAAARDAVVAHPVEYRARPGAPGGDR
jgi:hypothetical protein